MSNTTKEKLIQQVEKIKAEKGSRKAARALVNSRFMRFGFHINDLPDTSEVCDIVDNIEELIDKDNGFENNYDAVNEELKSIDLGFIEGLIMS